MRGSAAWNSEFVARIGGGELKFFPFRNHSPHPFKTPPRQRKRQPPMTPARCAVGCPYSHSPGLPAHVFLRPNEDSWKDDRMCHLHEASSSFGNAFADKSGKWGVAAKMPDPHLPLFYRKPLNPQPDPTRPRRTFADTPLKQMRLLANFPCGVTS